MRWFLIISSALVVVSAIVGVWVGVEAYNTLAKDLPEPEELEQYKSSLVTHVYDRHNELIADFFIEKRILVDLEDIPIYLRQATVAVEDSRFYSHRGFDPKGILRAAWVNFRAGKVREGGEYVDAAGGPDPFSQPGAQIGAKIARGDSGMAH